MNHAPNVGAKYYRVDGLAAKEERIARALHNKAKRRQPDSEDSARKEDEQIETAGEPTVATGADDLASSTPAKVTYIC